MISQLKDIGLSDKEAKVYLAMLELGPAPVLEISAKAGINRPTTYVQIEALKKFGLVSAQTKGKKQLFIAESPDHLTALVRQELATAQQKKEQLSEILPELRALFSLADEKPQVRYFEGVEGLKTIQHDFLTAKEKFLRGIACLDDVWALFPNQNNDYTNERLAKKIKTRFIYTTVKGAVLQPTDVKLLRESRFVPPAKLPFSADITIYDNKVAVAALRGKIGGAIIESKEIAESFRSLFDLTWESLEKK